MSIVDVSSSKNDLTLSTHEIVDFMSYVRQNGGFSTSKTLLTRFWT